jgi:hypothetical protein
MLSGAKLTMRRRRSRTFSAAILPNLIQCSIRFSRQLFNVRQICADITHDHSASSFVGKFAREELAQHVGDCQPMPEGDDLDAPALLWGDVDGEPGRKSVALDVTSRNWIWLPNPCLRVARSCDESALGIAAAHRVVLTISAASEMISCVAGPARASSPASRPVRAASAKITRWPI